MGAGRAGTALAVLWRAAGHRIVAVSGGDATAERAARYLPGVPVLDAAGAARDSEILVVAVPDDAIAATVGALTDAGRDPRRAVDRAPVGGHAPVGARRRPARRSPSSRSASLPDVPRCGERPRASAGLRGRDRRRRRRERVRRRAVGGGSRGRPFRLADDDRALYHAAAVFASNYLVATTWVAGELLVLAGVPDPAVRARAAAASDDRQRVRLGPGPGPHRPRGARRRRHDRTEPRGAHEIGTLGGRCLCRDGEDRPGPRRSVRPSHARGARRRR